jgi:hypothetical protein
MEAFFFGTVCCFITYAQTKMGPWGGNGGTACDIPEPPRSLQAVTIRSGEVINSIAFSYTDRTGQNRTAGPWGGDGALTATVRDFPNTFVSCYLICIVCYYLHYSHTPYMNVIVPIIIQDKTRFSERLNSNIVISADVLISSLACRSRLLHLRL